MVQGTAAHDAEQRTNKTNTMKLTRKDVLKKSIKRPLGKLRWEDLRGTMRDFAEANCVTVHEGGKVKIMKDRQGWYLKLKRDENGCVNESDLNEKAQQPRERQ